jgi:hypothetical protein
MTDPQQALFDRLAARVAARADLDLDTARAAVDDALVHRGDQVEIVREEVAAMIDEIRRPINDAYQAMGQALHRALDAAEPAVPAEDGERAGRTAGGSAEDEAGEAGEAARDHDRGMGMVAEHPDLAELDRILNALYERPDPGTGG